MQSQLDPAFTKQIESALACVRSDDLMALAGLPLATSALIEDCLAPSHQDPVSRANALRAMLHWAVDRLKHAGNTWHWVDKGWRYYNVLVGSYWGELAPAELAILMALAEQRIYEIRSIAIAALATVLSDELASPADLAGRRAYVGGEIVPVPYLGYLGRLILDGDMRRRSELGLDIVYGNAPKRRSRRGVARDQHLELNEARRAWRILRFLSIFRQPVLASQLTEFAYLVKCEPEQMQDGCANQFRPFNILLASAEGSYYRLHPMIRSYVLSGAVSERREWSRDVGKWYERARDYLEAAFHLREAGALDEAIALLYEHAPQIIGQSKKDQLREDLSNFQTEPSLWRSRAKLEILRGDLEDALDKKLVHYKRAVGIPAHENDPDAMRLKAQALSRMAEAAKRHVKIDDALHHYGTAIDLLTHALMQGHYPKDAVLAKNHIDRAWIYLQNQRDLDKAKGDLDAAQRFLDDRERALISDFHNAMARWADQSKLDWQTVFFHHERAWLAALEAEDVHRQINTGHNLGQDYVWNEDYAHGLEQLNQVRLLAIQSGDRDNEGLCDKSIGAAYFFRGDFRDAIHHYEQAALIFEEIGSRDRLGLTRHDLAEACCALGDFVVGKHHWDEAKLLADELNDTDLQQALSDLSSKHPQLLLQNADSAMERQGKAIDYIQRHGSITNRAYRELANVAQKQAARDLDDMVRRHVVQRTGQGRSVRYVLASNFKR